MKQEYLQKLRKQQKFNSGILNMVECSQPFKISLQQQFDQQNPIFNQLQKEQCCQFASNLLKQTNLDCESQWAIRTRKRIIGWFGQEIQTTSMTKFPVKFNANRYKQVQKVLISKIISNFSEEMQHQVFDLKQSQFTEAKYTQVRDLKNGLRNVALHLIAYQSQYLAHQSLKNEHHGSQQKVEVNSDEQLLKSIYKIQNQNIQRLREEWEIPNFKEKFDIYDSKDNRKRLLQKQSIDEFEVKRHQDSIEQQRFDI